LNSVFGFDLVEYNDGVATFQASILPEVTGLYQVATRVYPKNADLPHRQDFPLVKWL
jgi:phosphorylase/glycogen(starch) synthase